MNLEALIHRARRILPYRDEPTTQAALVDDGADPALAYLAVKAAIVLMRLMEGAR